MIRKTIRRAFKYSLCRISLFYGEYAHGQLCVGDNIRMLKKFRRKNLQRDLTKSCVAFNNVVTELLSSAEETKYRLFGMCPLVSTAPVARLC